MVIHIHMQEFRSKVRKLQQKQVAAVANKPARQNRAVDRVDDHCDKLAVDCRSSGAFCFVFCILSTFWPTTVQFITLWASIFVELSC